MFKEFCSCRFSVEVCMVWLAKPHPEGSVTLLLPGQNICAEKNPKPWLGDRYFGYELVLVTAN